MSSKVQDVKIFPGDESTKFMLLQRTIQNEGDIAFDEDPPYVLLNPTGNAGNGVDVTKWHSVTVIHTCQDYSIANYTNASLTFIPWRFYKPVTPFATATPPVTGLPPQGVWVADTEETVAIDPVSLGITQQKVYPTLNCDKMFFQITGIVAADREEEEAIIVAGPAWIRQAVFGVTPRDELGMPSSIIGSAGGGAASGGGTVTIPDPVNTNTIQLAGNAISLQAGNVGPGTQRVTLAEDDPAVILLGTIDADTGNIATSTSNIDTNTANIETAVEIMDDWDAVHDAVAGTDGVRLEGYASDSQVAAVSANGDDVRLALSKHGEVYLASHTYPTQSDRAEEIDPANQWYEFSTLAAVTNGTDGTYYYYIPMAAYTRLDLQAVISGGSGTVTLTVEASIQNDGTAPASLTYADVTNQAYGSASFTATQMLVDNSQFFGSFSYVRVKVVAASGANDGDWTIYMKKTWE